MIDLHRFRKEKNYDQKYIAAVTGLDQAVISKYENKKQVTSHVTDKLLQHFPELESYMIQDDLMRNGLEDINTTEISDENKKSILMKSLLNLTESNKILAESVHKAIALNEKLLEKIEKVW